MSAKTKKITAIAVIVLMVAAMAGTAIFAKSKMGRGQPGGGEPGQMQMQGGQQPPEMQDGQQPPEMQDGQQPPEMPSGDAGQMQKPGGEPQQNSSMIFYILFGVEGLILALAIAYLILSQGGKVEIKKAKKGNKIIAVILVVVLTAGSTFAGPFAVSKIGMKGGMPQQEENSDVEAQGVTVVDGTEETLGESYESTKEDYSAILVKNGGKATLTSTVKKSGDSSNTEQSEFLGINAAVLVQKDSTATIKNAKISTSAKGANAVFSTGENSKIKISNSTITSTGKSSARGLDATYGGSIEADAVKITTQGQSCATLATDRGEGTVSATNSVLETNGAGSPIIYSTGDISIAKSKGTANGAQITVVEGKNSATITDSSVICNGCGNRNGVDNCAIMIYQSMSGDSDEGTGTFTAKNSDLKVQSDSKYYENAPFFFVTNTDAVINLENNTLDYGSGVLLNAAGTDEWGNSGSNGGKVEFNATNQILSGDIVLDKLSSINMTLDEGSTLTGSINNDNEASEASLTLSKDSKLTLTGDTYLTSFNNADSSNSNIITNGYTLYVNGKSVK